MALSDIPWNFWQNEKKDPAADRESEEWTLAIALDVAKNLPGS
jgi:hypothetical protein